MTNKERVHAALEGKPVDRCPVAALYNHLYHQDHFAELTGLPAWRMHQWLASEPEAHAEIFAAIHAAVPFETLQPQGAPSRAWRERQEFVEKDGHPYRHDRVTGEWARLDVPTASGHAIDYFCNQTQSVFDRADADERVVALPAQKQIADGANDYIEAVVRRLGAEEFVVSGGVVGTMYCCHSYVGLTNLLAMLIEAPGLVDHLSRRILEQNVETIRRFAAAGGDAIFIDDALATSDVISVAMYERFCLPGMREMVREIQRLGQKAILIYYGGVADRLEQIASLGADALLVETSMKGYVNDLDRIADAIGGRVTLFGNMDPIGVLQNGTDEELAAEVERQLLAGHKARGFLLSPASPITPATPLSRVQRFIQLGRSFGSGRPAAWQGHPRRLGLC